MKENKFLAQGPMNAAFENRFLLVTLSLMEKFLPEILLVKQKKKQRKSFSII